jgi:xylulokinase
VSGPPTFCGIDLGTSGPKVVVVGLDGRIVDHTHEPVGLRLGADGAAEQDPIEWWEATGRACRTLAGRVPEAWRALAGVCCTGQVSGTVPVGHDHQPVAPAIIWMDERGADYTRSITGGPIRIDGYSPLKLWRWIRRTGGAPSQSGKDPPGHIGWFRETHPDLYERTRVFLEPIDWLNLQLCGEISASHDTIGLHWVADMRDLGAVDYDPSLLKLCGLDRERLPPLVRPGSIIGAVRPEAAELLGLPVGLPVCAATPDLHSAAVGAGALSDLRGHLCLGSSAWICAHVPYLKCAPLDNIGTTPSVRPDRWLLINAQENAGVCLQFAAEQLLFPPGPGRPDDLYGEVERLAATSPTGSNGVLFLPWLFGERAPIADPDLRGAFVNLSLTTSRADLLRAVHEGVALNTRWLLEAVEKFTGRPFEDLRLVGGGARSALWAGIMADVLERPIIRVEQPWLANARGAALLAAVAGDHLDFAGVEERIPVAGVCEPSAERADALRERYDVFRAFHKRTRSLFRRLNRR